MKLAILTPNKSAHTETFIQNHIDHLEFDKTVIYGRGVPFMTESSQPSKYAKMFNLIQNSLRNQIGISNKSLKEVHLKKLLRQEKIDVVFAEYLNTGGAVVDICKSLNIPLVAIALGYEISKYHVIEKHKKAYQRLFKYASKIVVVSNHMTKALVELGCPKNIICFSPAGPDSSFFKISPNFSSKNIFAIGRFVEKKAPHLTILSFEKALSKHPDAQLIMAGDGPLLSVCQDLVSTLKIENSVTFLGRISQDEQRKMLRDAVIFIQHSKIASDGDSEGTPVSIVEASAAGLPVVSTFHAGIPDVVIHNKTGLLCDENDTESMANHIIQFLDDMNLAKQYGLAGKQYIQENFSLKHHIETVQKVLEEANTSA